MESSRNIGLASINRIDFLARKMMYKQEDMFGYHQGMISEEEEWKEFELDRLRTITEVGTSFNFSFEHGKVFLTQEEYDALDK